jgi:pimeloyl-ACP methyl ester carboxylesterase
MKVDGVEVVIEGAGEDPVVMIHGWPDTHRLWDRQVEALRDRFRCVRFTLPGFAPDAPHRAVPLDEVVDFIGRVVDAACDSKPATLLLHDWGCFFGYQFAARHPARVRRIVGVDVGDAGSRRHRSELRMAQKLQIVGYQSWLAAAWRIGGRIGDAMARRMARAARAPAPGPSISSQMGYPYFVQWAGRGYRHARRFVPACPMLFLYGRRKPFMFHSTGWAQEIATMPGNRVIGFDCGHWVMVARAPQFNQAVLDWLADEGRPT